MVRLSKIYTRTGDDGTTGLGSGDRVPKDDARVWAYGEVDEANAALGMAVVACDADPSPKARRAADVLRSCQHDLFDVGADLCVPTDPEEAPGTKLRIQPRQTQRLEAYIDEFNEGLPALNSFVLPGGSAAAAALHLARTIVRRAERCTVALYRAAPARVSPETVKYLNRLSDLLFVLSRYVNAGAAGDVLWKPGANR